MQPNHLPNGCTHHVQWIHDQHYKHQNFAYNDLIEEGIIKRSSSISDSPVSVCLSVIYKYIHMHNIYYKTKIKLNVFYLLPVHMLEDFCRSPEVYSIR